MERMPSVLIRSVEIEVPRFTDAVKATEDGSIMLRLDSFAGDPSLFYHCVWYAISHGKDVEIVSGD